MSASKKLVVIAGVQIIALTVALAAYGEFWLDAARGAAFGVDPVFYPVGVAVGFVVAMMPLVRPRRPGMSAGRGTTKGTSSSLPNSESDEDVPFGCDR